MRVHARQDGGKLCVNAERVVAHGFFWLINSNRALTFSSTTATRKSSLLSTMMSVMTPSSRGHAFIIRSSALIWIYKLQYNLRIRKSYFYCAVSPANISSIPTSGSSSKCAYDGSTSTNKPRPAAARRTVSTTATPIISTTTASPA